jgi:sugar lactone lactonase YvrE
MNALHLKNAIPAILFALAQSSAVLSAQELTFTTIAGGSQGTVDGLDTNAAFSNPVAVAVDSSGNVFIADQNNNSIRRAAPTGTNWLVTTLAGSSNGTNASFDGPSGIAVDAIGNLFVSDTYNGVIRMMTPMGTNWNVATIAGTAGNFGNRDGAGGAARFSSPNGIAVDAGGNIFVADTVNHSIREIISSNGVWIVSTIAGGNNGSADGTGLAAQFSSPVGLAVDRSDRVYVADQFNNAIRQVAPQGTNWMVTTIAGNGVAGRSDGTGTNAIFHGPVGITVDSSNNIYVADVLNCAVRKLVPAGATWNVSTVAGGSRGDADGTGSNVTFNLPFGIGTDPFGNVFVADSGNNAIRAGEPAGSPPALGAIQVNISPNNAIGAGAAWSLDAGPYQTNGATLSGVAPGNHTISFAIAAGFTTPALAAVTVTAHQTTELAITYAAAIANAGSLEVTLSPDAVAQAGAQWAVDGGPWHTNSEVIAGLSVGPHSVSFNTIPGWTAPPGQLASITNGQTSLVTGLYILQTGTLQVAILPPPVVSAGAGWRLDNGGLHTGGATMAGVPIGNHTISFNSVLGWNTPSNISVTITNNVTGSVAVAFTQAGPPQLWVSLSAESATCQLFLTGMVGSNYVIQTASDLGVWNPLSTNIIPAVGFVQITNLGSTTNGRAFYRAALR